MRVAIVFNDPGSGADESDLDVLVQRDAVESALQQLGHDVISLPCTLNLALLPGQLVAHNIDVVFNLVESLAGTDRLQVLVPMLLDGLKICYTGAGAAVMLATGDKVAVKRRLGELGLPTADWVVSGDMTTPGTGRYIIKARFEHASIGMDDSAVLDVNSAVQLQAEIDRRARLVGCEMFAERFVAGREFNISVIAGEAGAGEVLAPAEIDFSGFPAGKPHIVGYDAKWSEQSAEYHTTPRQFQFAGDDAGLLAKLARLSEVIWESFGLTGYVRIDYRVDDCGQPFVLEINTNPCLSPDAGFVAAVETSGHNFVWAVERVLASACSPQVCP